MTKNSLEDKEDETQVERSKVNNREKVRLGAGYTAHSHTTYRNSHGKPSSLTMHHLLKLIQRKDKA